VDKNANDYFCDKSHWIKVPNPYGTTPESPAIWAWGVNLDEDMKHIYDTSKFPPNAVGDTISISEVRGILAALLSSPPLATNPTGETARIVREKSIKFAQNELTQAESMLEMATVQTQNAMDVLKSLLGIQSENEFKKMTIKELVSAWDLGRPVGSEMAARLRVIDADYNAQCSKTTI